MDTGQPLLFLENARRGISVHAMDACLMDGVGLCVSFKVGIGEVRFAAVCRRCFPVLCSWMDGLVGLDWTWSLRCCGWMGDGGFGAY